MRHHSILLICAICACSGDALSPYRGAPTDLTGAWEQDVGATIPGNTFLMTLRDSADLVIGMGSYAGEAGPFGALVVSGTALGDSVHLQIVYVPDATVFPLLKPDTARLDGAFSTHDRIDGMFARGNSAAGPFRLVRLQPIVDPH